MTLEVSNIVCPTCGSPNHMHHLVGANVGYWDMKCFNCNSYFNFDELYNHRIAEVIKPMTNADKIRAMDNYELSNFLAHVHYKNCPMGANWVESTIDGECVPGEDEDCPVCWLAWLKQESEGEG